MRDKKATGDVMYLEMYSNCWQNMVSKWHYWSTTYMKLDSGPSISLLITMITLKEKPEATKCSDHHTISLITHWAKIVVRIFKRRNERKIEDVLWEDLFGFRRWKGTRDANSVAENNIRTTFGNRWEIVCLLHRMTEGIWPCKMHQIHADPEGKWYWLVWKKTDQQTVCGSVLTYD